VLFVVNLLLLQRHAFDLRQVANYGAKLASAAAGERVDDLDVGMDVAYVKAHIAFDLFYILAIKTQARNYEDGKDFQSLLRYLGFSDVIDIIEHRIEPADTAAVGGVTDLFKSILDRFQDRHISSAPAVLIDCPRGGVTGVITKQRL
jgi:hypothetical protein